MASKKKQPQQQTQWPPPRTMTAKQAEPTGGADGTDERLVIDPGRLHWVQYYHQTTDSDFDGISVEESDTAQKFWWPTILHYETNDYLDYNKTTISDEAKKLITLDTMDNFGSKFMFAQYLGLGLKYFVLKENHDFYKYTDMLAYNMKELSVPKGFHDHLDLYPMFMKGLDEARDIMTGDPVGSSTIQTQRGKDLLTKYQSEIQEKQIGQKGQIAFPASQPPIRMAQESPTKAFPEKKCPYVVPEAEQQETTAVTTESVTIAPVAKVPAKPPASKTTRAVSKKKATTTTPAKNSPALAAAVATPSPGTTTAPTAASATATSSPGTNSGTDKIPLSPSTPSKVSPSPSSTPSKMKTPRKSKTTKRHHVTSSLTPSGAATAVTADSSHTIEEIIDSIPGIDLPNPRDSFGKVATELIFSGWTRKAANAQEQEEYNVPPGSSIYQPVNCNEAVTLDESQVRIYLERKCGWVNPKDDDVDDDNDDNEEEDKQQHDKKQQQQGPSPRVSSGKTKKAASAASAKKRVKQAAEPSRVSRRARKTPSNDGAVLQDMSKFAYTNKFKEENEPDSEFYTFKNLMAFNTHCLGWLHMKESGLHDEKFVIGDKAGPHGTYGEDFFFEEKEVKDYCRQMDYKNRYKEEYEQWIKDGQPGLTETSKAGKKRKDKGDDGKAPVISTPKPKKKRGRPKKSETTTTEEAMGAKEKAAESPAPPPPAKKAKKSPPKKPAPTSPARNRPRRAITPVKDTYGVSTAALAVTNAVKGKDEADYDDFYNFGVLMEFSRACLNWLFLRGGSLHNEKYVVGEGAGPQGEAGVDYFHEESEVVDYCKKMDYKTKYGKQYEQWLRDRKPNRKHGYDDAKEFKTLQKEKN